MSTIRASVRHRRSRTLIGALAVLALAVLAITVVPAMGAAGGPSEAGVQPVEVSMGGEPNDCKYAGTDAPGPSAAVYEYRIVNPTSNPDGFTDTQSGKPVTFKLTVTGGAYMAFDVSGGAAVLDVIVKGGAKSTWWDYDGTTTVGPVIHDAGLHGPVKGNDVPFAISHVSFCYSESGLKGKVWEDTNENGSLDATESVQQGWKIHLFSGSGSFVSQDTTTDTGAYSFPEALIGQSYIVCEEKPDGDTGEWHQTTPTTKPSVCVDNKESFGHQISSLALGQAADFGNVPLIQSTCETTMKVTSPDRTLDYEVLISGTSGKCAEQFVMRTYRDGTSPIAVLYPVDPTDPTPVPVVEKLTWRGYGTDQNPVTMWYDDTAPYTTKSTMLMCLRDPRKMNEDFTLDASLTGVLPPGTNAEGGAHTSCVIESTESAGGTYEAYVFSSIDGLRGEQ